MNRLRQTVNYLRRFRGVKYVIVIVGAVAIVGFLDDNSVWSHYRNKQKIGELEAEIQRYQRLYENDREQLRLLDTDPKAIEKIARERYFMKTADEDIFVLSDDIEAPEQQFDDETTE